MLGCWGLGICYWLVSYVRYIGRNQSTHKNRTWPRVFTPLNNHFVTFWAQYGPFLTQIYLIFLTGSSLRHISSYVGQWNQIFVVVCHSQVVVDCYKTFLDDMELFTKLHFRAFFRVQFSYYFSVAMLLKEGS